MPKKMTRRRFNKADGKNKERGGDTMNIAREKLRDMFQMMVRSRRFEERLAEEVRKGYSRETRTGIPRGVHLSLGREAIAAGACANLRADDYVAVGHRGMGVQVARGLKMNLMMAEIFGRKTGYNKGRGGSLHIADFASGVLLANSIVGASIPIATGVALSAKMRGTDQVCLDFFSDGACNTSRFHEGINLGSIWKLPVVYIIENDLYGFSTPFSYHMNIPDIAVRASAYGIPGVIVDGNDVVAVYKAVSEAVARARKGEGPSLIECKTYTRGGLYEGDPFQTYKPEEEYEEWLKKDPILKFRDQLIKTGVLTEKEADEIDRAVLGEVDKAVKFAVESAFPDPAEALEDVYA